jgi:DHA1 family multidrug/chloramphenicol efflux transport protein-like MFS transporter
MRSISKISQINRATLLFPFALVLFEFAVYIANDMVQPAMLMVTQEFKVDASWVPLSMAAFLIGGTSLSWLTGPLSDQIGRRPVLLGGVFFFIVSCLATYLVHSIESFMALRVLQGIGLCFISTVGYATVQEAFDEKNAVKVSALMSNVALLAPMIGPLGGAALIEYAPWRSCFLFIAIISFFALIGLWLKMPETVFSHTEKPPISRIFHEYLALFKQSRFVMLALLMPMLGMPLIGWIAISPLILVNDFGYNLLEYGLWQLPVLGSLVLGNFCLMRATDHWPLGRSALISCWPLAGGVVLILLGLLFPLFFHFNTPLLLVLGICCCTFSDGLATAVLYRFALTASEQTKGTVSAGISIIVTVGYTIGIEVARLCYLAAGTLGFTLAMSAFSCYYIFKVRACVHSEMSKRHSTPL